MMKMMTHLPGGTDCRVTSQGSDGHTVGHAHRHCAQHSPGAVTGTVSPAQSTGAHCVVDRSLWRRPAMVTD